jgi:hypothetical protein
LIWNLPDISIIIFYNYGPKGSGGVTIGETVFTYVYMENIFQKSSEKRTTVPEKLKFT